MIYPDSMKDEYDAFVTGMVTEYNRNWGEKGDSWKIFKSAPLYDLLIGSYNTYNELLKNPNHLFDIANHAMFLWYNIQKEKSNDATIQCPECGEWIKREEYDLHLMKTRPDIMIERLKSLEEKSIRMEKDRDLYAKDLEDMANERDAYKDAIFSIPKNYDITLKHIILTLENKVKKK